MNPTWRERAAPIIAAVLAETQGQGEKAIKIALRDAYPWGERSMYPYTIWCDEIRRQRFGFTAGQAKVAAKMRESAVVNGQAAMEL